MNRHSLAHTCLALAFAWGCSPSDSQTSPTLPSDVWAPGVLDQPVETELGSVTHGASEYLTQWHALEIDRLSIAAPTVLGDFRDALLISTPSHFNVELPASPKPRKLVTAVRRSRPHEQNSLHCEVFWSEDGALQSLVKLQLPPSPELLSEPWHKIEINLPITAGRLEFISRDPIPSGGKANPVAVAWQSPWIGPSSPLAATTPDVLLLTIDTFRADALAHAPNLQALLQEGALWPEAISPSNWTLPSYASLFTGLPPTEHGAGRGGFSIQATGEMERRNLTPLNSGLPSLSQLFREAGYATAMFHQSPMLESWTGLAAGFEQYIRLNDQTVDSLAVAQEWWNTHSNRPRFLVVHLMAPHLPYRFGPEPDPLAKLDMVNFFQEDHTPEQREEFFEFTESEIQIIKDRYYEEVRRVDRQLKPFLDEILNYSSSSANTLFAFHSDHGEELWDATSFEHGHSFDDSVIQVPVALRWPGHIPASFHTTPVPAYGLSASLLSAAGITHHWQVNLENPPQEFASSMPFYRSRTGGRRYLNQEVLDRPFHYQMNSGGQQAAISAAKLRMLEELGYLASKDLVRSNQEPGDK